MVTGHLGPSPRHLRMPYALRTVRPIHMERPGRYDRSDQPANQRTTEHIHGADREHPTARYGLAQPRRQRGHDHAEDQRPGSGRAGESPPPGYLRAEYPGRGRDQAQVATLPGTVHQPPDCCPDCLRHRHDLPQTLCRCGSHLHRPPPQCHHRLLPGIQGGQGRRGTDLLGYAHHPGHARRTASGHRCGRSGPR